MTADGAGTTVGILGAGKLGTVLARLSVAAGYRTLIAASADPAAIGLIVEVMAPGAEARPSVEVADRADIVILAVPLGKYRTLPAAQLAGKVVVDAMNYWPSVDGAIPAFRDAAASSLVIARSLPGARLVKALSHLGYHQLDEDARPAGSPDRHAMAIAGDDLGAVREVAELVDRFGFDPVVAGGLAAGARFGPGTVLFGTSTDRAEVARLLAAADVRRPDTAAERTRAHAHAM